MTFARIAAVLQRSKVLEGNVMSVRLCWWGLALLAVSAGATDVGVISPEALTERINSADTALVILDVRTPEEFAAGHVPGAINIPHDALEFRLSELPSAAAADLVVYCRSGRRSALALGVLSQAGFTRLQQLEGDYLRWTAAGRAIEQEQPASLSGR